MRIDSRNNLRQTSDRSSNDGAERSRGESGNNLRQPGNEDHRNTDGNNLKQPPSFRYEFDGREAAKQNQNGNEKQKGVTNRIRSFDGPGIPEQVKDATEAARNASATLSNNLRNLFPDAFEESTTSRLSSLVDKYKGPDSIELP